MFTLFFSYNALAQLYEDFEVEEEVAPAKHSFLLGYSNTPFTFKEATLISELPYYSDFEANLPEVNMQHGINASFLFFPDSKKIYAGVHVGYSFSSPQQGRKRDQLFNFLLVSGYEQPIFRSSENHLLRFELGLGGRTFSRPISNVDQYRVALVKTDVVVVPSISYDLNLFDEKVYLFFQTSYIAALNFPFLHTRLRTSLRRNSDEVERYRLRNSDLIVSNGARLDVQDMFEFSIGLRLIY